MPNRQISELNDSQMEAIVTLKYFRNARDLLLKLGGYPSDVPQLFYIQSSDLFRPISCQQKYLMDYNYIYLITLRYLRYTLIF